MNYSSLKWKTTFSMKVSNSSSLYLIGYTYLENWLQEAQEQKDRKHSSWQTFYPNQNEVQKACHSKAY